MTTLKGQAELDQYKLTRREVADYLGITTNAVRMSQRGKNCHNLEYRFDGKQFLFKVPRRDLVPSMIKGPLVQHSGTPKSTLGKHKKINRGATHRGEANYKNEATRMYNEGKILKNIEGKFKSPEHKRIFNEMTEAGFKEAYEISKRAKLKSLQENTRVTPEVFPGGLATSINQSHGKYGGILTAPGIAEGDRKALQREDRKYEEEHKTPFKQGWQTQERLDGTRVKVRVNTREIDFRPRNSSYFIGHASYGESDSDREDPGSVEITQHQIDRATPIEERTKFPTARGVEESIYRARKHLFKKTGEIY